ncbi:unnamed protein product [Lota lota]
MNAKGCQRPIHTNAQGQGTDWPLASVTRAGTGTTAVARWPVRAQTSIVTATANEVEESVTCYNTWSSVQPDTTQNKRLSKKNKTLLISPPCSSGAGADPEDPPDLRFPQVHADIAPPCPLATLTPQEERRVGGTSLHAQERSAECCKMVDPREQLQHRNREMNSDTRAVNPGAPLHPGKTWHGEEK